MPDITTHYKPTTFGNKKAVIVTVCPAKNGTVIDPVVYGLGHSVESSFTSPSDGLTAAFDHTTNILTVKGKADDASAVDVLLIGIS